MKKLFIKNKNYIAFFNKKATSDYWDNHWSSDGLRKQILKCTNDGIFIPMVIKYLPAGSRVLEGGCGNAHKVHALQCNGYIAIGIDFAEKTVEAINEAVPDLDVRVGDVRNLDIENDSLDGYISVGVIEHFWNGYKDIIQEMKRTLKPGGYLFISFPYMSFLRKLKVFLRLYPRSSYYSLETMKDTFYQFVLNHNKVVKNMKSMGFNLVEMIKWDGIKGFKDEVPLLKPFLQQIYDGKSHQKYRNKIDSIFKKLASHNIILVMRKEP